MAIEICKVVIPSHKRHDRVLTTSAVANAILCVAESQAALYKACNPNIEIVTHPDSVIGLNPKRNWIIKHFGTVFQLDDDIHNLKRVYTEIGEKIAVDADTAYELIQQAADVATQMGAYLFSFSNVPAPVGFNTQKPITVTGYHTGCAHGVIKGSKLWYDTNVNEDYFVSCLNAYHHRYSYKDSRFYWSQKDTFVSRGGLAEFRNIEREEEDFNFLQRVFGSEVITLKRNLPGKAELKHPFQKTMRLPF